jgi:predicted branched-subunit amino acid permease
MTLNRTMVRRGVGDALPLFLTVIPFALIVGLAVVESGINPLVGWSSSPIIFGGAAQLVLLTLIGSGTALAAAVSAALVIQARHLMYSAAMAPVFQRQPRWFRWFGPYVLIDQMFALAATRAHEEPDDFRSYYLGAASVYITGWNLTTAIGLLVGPRVPQSWELGFAVPLMFVVLLVIGIDRWPKLVAAAAAAAVTYLTAGLPNRMGLIVGALVGIAAGVTAARLRR